MSPSITDDDDDDDDEAHFSDSSDRTIKPFRLRQKEPAYLGIPSHSSVSNSSPAGAGLDSRLSKTEMRMKLPSWKGELQAAEGAEREVNICVGEFGAKIRGEEIRKAEAARRIKQWEATPAKTAFQSI
ncbi:hypothetical protein HZ326_27034 [Fusarium oxysporum f. sp. albedinis]|nr:hypothetical protein HZ326_27034 [Fusarium oxysporum f. sp. albedinis]